MIFVEWHYCNVDIVDDDKNVEFDINLVCEE